MASKCHLNLLCPKCWGMIKQVCKCKYRNVRPSKCAKK